MQQLSHVREKLQAGTLGAPMARALLVLRMLAMASTAWGYADELLKQEGLENRCARRLGPAEAHIMNRPQVGVVEPAVNGPRLPNPGTDGHRLTSRRSPAWNFQAPLKWNRHCGHWHCGSVIAGTRWDGR